MHASVAGASSGGGGGDEITVTFAPVSVIEASDQGPSFQGLGGHTAYGGGIPFAQDAYFWLSVDGMGADPGADPNDTTYTGMTGYEIPLTGSGPFAASAVATAAATAAGPSGYTVTPVGDTVTVADNGLDQAATVAVYGTLRAPRNAGQGRSLGQQRLVTGSSTNAGTSGFCQIDPADVPSGAFRVIGFEIRRGTTVTDPVQMALASGGVNSNPQGARIDHERSMGNSGSGALHREFLEEPVYYSGGETLWIGTHGFGASGQLFGGGDDTGFLADGGGDNLFLTDSVQDDFPFTDPVAAVTSSFNFPVATRIIIQEAPYSNDGSYRFLAGAREGIDDGDLFPGGTDVDNIFVGWGLALPNITGMSLHNTRINLGTHAAGASNQIRVEWWTADGGTTTFVGDNLVSLIGVTTDSQGTGWSDVQTEGPIAVVAGGSYRFSIKGSPAGGAESDTTFSFDLGGAGILFSGYPLYALQGGDLVAEELEVISATAGGDETTLNFDPQVATASPNNADGTVTFPSNLGMIELELGTDAPTVAATGG